MDSLSFLFFDIVGVLQIHVSWHAFGFTLRWCFCEIVNRIMVGLFHFLRITFFLLPATLQQKHEGNPVNG